MLELYRLDHIAWVLVLVGLMACVQIPGCSAGGGKGLDRVTDTADVRDAESSEDLSANFQTDVSIHTREPTEQDPFGRIPLGWPDDIALHPKAMVALSGKTGDGGFYLIMLVSPNVATTLGIQKYHLDALAGWESIQEYEGFPNKDDNHGTVAIVAQRRGGRLRITSGEVVPGLLSTFPEEESKFWLENVGSAPLVIRLYYNPLPD